MNKIFLLSLANIRKSKGSAVSISIMFLISAMLLNIGLLIFVNFGSFFTKTTNELNTSNVYYLMSSSLYNDQVEAYINNNENVLNTQKEDSFWVSAQTKYNDNVRAGFFLLNDANKPRNMSKWKFIGAHLPTDEMSIYLPYLYQLDGGYKLNDEFEMILKEERFTFTIKGFIEDAYFSSAETGLLGLYLPHETYQKVTSELSDTNRATLIFANLKKVNKEVETGIKNLTQAEDLSSSSDFTNALFSLDLSLVKLSRIMMASIVSVMVIAFSAIISAVCLFAVRFRIGNSIEDDTTKIGALKAIGYTSGQIILSVVIQFISIAFVGSIIGILLSYLTTPALSDVFAQQSGLKWVQGFDLAISCISLFIILLIVTNVAAIAARRISKLNPIVALRGGITTHSFRKNHIPLSTAKGSLSIVLAIKSMLQNIKQSIMIGVIITAVTFASTFAVVMFYNTAIDNTAFAETPGLEISDIMTILKADTDPRQFIDNIRKMDDVRKAQFIDEAKVDIDNNSVSVYIMDDYSTKETNSVYEGRYPLHSNEIVIAGHFADMIDKTIGDRVTVKVGDTEDNYLITGLSQGANMGGMNASITRDGLLKLSPGFKQQTLQIYLNEGTNTGEYVKTIERLYDAQLLVTIDMDQQMQIGMGAYISIVSKIGVAILIVTIAVVILILYFVISSSVIRRKRELGIYKAIGFTTPQLMHQLSLSFLPPILLGVVIGSIIGITQTNAIMSVAQRSMGIMKASYIITPVYIALFGVCIVIISYLTSMLITSPIRKISAYAQVTE
ncbi:MAG TPA: FtsX-like permease family protein [Bacillota bacterium]|nr:FtsX-like permease family protein [Bacillota bacterium]